MALEALLHGRAVRCQIMNAHADGNCQSAHEVLDSTHWTAFLVYFHGIICDFPCASPHTGAVQRQSDNANIDGYRQRADVVQDSA